MSFLIPLFIDEGGNDISSVALSLIGGTRHCSKQIFTKQLELHVDKGTDEVVSFYVNSSSNGNITISNDGLLTYHGNTAFNGSNTVEIGLLSDGVEVDTLSINVTGYPVSTVDLDNGNALVFFNNVHPPHGVDAIAGGDTSGDIWSQQLSPAGVAIGAPEKVNVTDYYTQSDPVAHQFSDGSSVVAWSHSQNGNSFALKYQLFDASGQKVGDEVSHVTEDAAESEQSRSFHKADSILTFKLVDQASPLI